MVNRLLAKGKFLAYQGYASLSIAHRKWKRCDFLRTLLPARFSLIFDIFCIFALFGSLNRQMCRNFKGNCCLTIFEHVVLLPKIRCWWCMQYSSFCIVLVTLYLLGYDYFTITVVFSIAFQGFTNMCTLVLFRFTDWWIRSQCAPAPFPLYHCLGHHHNQHHLCGFRLYL